MFTVCFVLYPCRLSTYDIVITTYSLLAKEIPTTKHEGEVPGSNLSVEVRFGDARELRLRDTREERFRDAGEEILGDAEEERMPGRRGLRMPGKCRWKHT